MIGLLLAMVLVGLLAGAIARLVVPGRDPMSIPATILLGLVGSFVGGFLADALFRSDAEDRGFGPAGLFGSIVGAVIVLLVYRWVQTRPGVRASR
ncbi:MAG: GlsB/YeaQ/YmgE family stress response membrane protein [Acidimicrobiia bacterium]